MASVSAGFPAYAVTVDEPYTEPDESERADVTVTITSPAEYSGEIEFYCGLETYYLTVAEGETETRYTLNVPKGKSHIGFVDTDDVVNAFTFSYEKELDTDRSKSINVSVNYAAGLTDVSEEEIEAPEDIAVDTLPAEYDYSDGKEFGIISISCTPYGSIDAVTYKLTGSEQIYDIVLDKDHNFMANVKLPGGSYRESSDINVTPNEMASISEGLSFAWGHRNNEGYFGNNYQLNVGQNVSVNDLYIRMNYQGDLREVDDTILLTAKINQAYENLKNEKREEFLKNEFGDERPTIAETETEAPAIAEAAEEKNEGRKIPVLPIAIGILAVAGIAGIVVARKKHKEDA